MREVVDVYIPVGDNKNRLQPASFGGLNGGVKGCRRRGRQDCLLMSDS